MKSNLKAFFRVSKRLYQEIVNQLFSDLKGQVTRFRNPIPVAKKILIGLFRLGSTSELRVAAQLFGVGFRQLLEFSISSRRLLLNILGTKFIGPALMRNFWKSQKISLVFGIIHFVLVPLMDVISLVVQKLLMQLTSITTRDGTVPFCLQWPTHPKNSSISMLAAQVEWTMALFFDVVRWKRNLRHKRSNFCVLVDLMMKFKFLCTWLEIARSL